MWKCIISKQITIGLQHTLKIPRKAISDNDLNGKPVKQVSTTAHALYKIILITCHDVCSACHNNIKFVGGRKEPIFQNFFT